MSEIAPNSQRKSAAAIEIREFSFSYRNSESWQLTNISLTVAKGERVAIMGATGAGKSTLAMALNGLVPQHHEGEVVGTVTVAGLNVQQVDIATTVRRVGLVMQDPETQITGQTALDDTCVGPANFGLPRDEVLDKARKALALVGLGELAARDTNLMSGGQKQRLVIAGIFAMDSDILVLDEPTSELDPQGTVEVFDIVRKLSEDDGKTIVLVEHEPELTAGWADRLVVLSGGRVVFDGRPEDFFANREQVARAGLRLPQVTDAALKLAAVDRFTGPLPVTLSDALQVLEPWSPERSVLPVGEDCPRQETKPVIEARKLSHIYPGGVDALNEVSVTIHEGEFVAVVGRNGAGKTTFARHLNGLLRPTSGELLIAGERTEGRRISDLAMHVGYVFQNPDHQIFANSVRDEIAYGLKNLGWDAEQIDRRVSEVLRQVKMTDLEDRHPFNLGKGQRQQLAVASVLALSPQVLVIDEPTTGQDWLGARAMIGLVRELNEQGHTILMITQDMSLVAEYADRTLVFAGGRLIADTDPRSLFGNADLLTRGTLVPPQVTSLAAALGCPTTVTTIDEFAQEWGIAETAGEAHCAL